MESNNLQGATSDCKIASFQLMKNNSQNDFSTLAFLTSKLNQMNQRYTDKNVTKIFDVKWHQVSVCEESEQDQGNLKMQAFSGINTGDIVFHSHTWVQKYLTSGIFEFDQNRFEFINALKYFSK